MRLKGEYIMNNKALTLTTLVIVIRERKRKRERESLGVITGRRALRAYRLHKVEGRWEAPGVDAPSKGGDDDEEQRASAYKQCD